MSTSDRKRALREELLAARARLSPGERARHAEAIAGRLASVPAYARSRTLALYATMGAEVDTAPVARHALVEGKRLAWPRLQPGGIALTFASCAPESLVAGPLGTRQPPAGAPGVPPDSIDCVLVPGVAFDPRGVRLGRGAGHYDATLESLPRSAFRIGLAFEAQVVAELPREPHDALLDLVVTERRLLWPPP